MMTDPAAALDAIFEVADGSDVPGGVVAVRRSGDVLYRRGYGLASIEQGVANTPATRMRIGSSSKQFTCFAAILLAEDGRFDLDRPVDTLLPGLPAHPVAPTPRQLMNHTGGYRCHLDAAGLANGSAILPPDWAMQSILRQTGVSFAPGQGQTYCNAGYHLLSHLIERAADEPFEAFLKRRIFDPLGMTNTQSVPSDMAITPGLATLHVPTADGGWRRGIFPSEQIRGEGALISTVDDLMRWLDELRGPHRLASDAAWGQMLTVPMLPDGTPSIYALGLYRHAYRGVEVIHHAGAVIGGAAQVLTVPSLELDIVMLSNGGRLAPMPTVNRILDTLLADQLAETQPPLASAADFRHLDGVFYAADGAPVIGFGVVGDLLGISIAGSPPYPVLRDHGDALVVGFDDAALGPIVLDRAALAAGTPATVAFRESGVAATLARLDPEAVNRDRLAAELAGRYQSRDVGAEVTIGGDGPFSITIRGELGHVAGVMEPLGGDRLRLREASAPVGSEAVQLIRHNGSITGFTVDSTRARGFRFDRIA